MKSICCHKCRNTNDSILLLFRGARLNIVMHVDCVMQFCYKLRPIQWQIESKREIKRGSGARIECKLCLYAFVTFEPHNPTWLMPFTQISQSSVFLSLFNLLYTYYFICAFLKQQPMCENVCRL